MCRNFRLGSVCGVILLLLSSAKCQTQTERIIDPRPRLLSNSSTTISGPQARIVGGTNAQQYRYPYVVSLIAFEDSHACGGSLVAPDVVLTAAHCQGVLSRAHIGRWNRLDSSEDFDDIEVVSEIPHPGYVDEGFKSDYMVLKLATPSSKQIVRLNENSNIPRGDVADEMIAMGFGDTIFGVKSLADVLQEVSLTYVPNAVCELSRDSTLGLTYQGEIIDSMLCAGDAGEDSCQGDSGGPLIVSGGSAEQDVLVGIISWGFGCALPAFPGVYSRISAEMDWLRTTICEVSNDPPGYLNCNNTATLPPRSVPVTVSIQLDDFPEEISWSIQDAVDGTVFAEVPFGVYTDAGSRVGETVFLPAGSSVVFKIEDSFGDGLCCNTPGNYLVSLGSRPYGDVLVSGGGDFHGTIFHDFNVPTDYKETNTEDDTPPIGEGKIPLTIVLQLDESPREIGWKIERLGIEVETVIHIPAGVYKIPGATIVRTVILEKNELYYFYVYDVTSNGIDGGMVQLFLGTAETEDESKIIFESDGAFKGGVDYSFLATEDPLPTEAPLGDSNPYLTLQIYFDLFPGEIGVQLRASYAETAIARQSTQENTVIFFRPPRYYSNYVNERVTERIPIPMPRAGTSREFILIVTDSFSDGLCCNSNRTNQTGYTLYNGDPIAGDVLVDSRFIGVAREVSIFTVENDGVDGSENNNGQTSTGPEIDLIEIKVSITLDNFPDETGFYIEDDSGFKIADFPAGTYKDLGQLVEEVFTVPAGLYTFTITDAYGDGINRDDSYYRIDFVESGVDRRPVLAGNGIFVSQKSHVFALEGKSANYPMTIKFTTDEKPEEFGFVVKRLDILDADALVSSVPQGTYTEKGASITETIMVTERALYRIFLEDAGKDGIGGQIEIIMGSDNFNGKSLTIDGVDLSADHIKIYAGQPPATRPSGISMDLRITFDDFPQEVEWILVGGVDLFGSRTSPSGKHEVIAYGPMEPYGEALARKENVETIILPDHKGEKIFSLIVTDSAGDGVCCSFGSGGPIELYQGSANKTNLLFSKPFEGVDRVVKSFVVVGNKESAASTRIVPFVVWTSLLLVPLFLY